MCISICGVELWKGLGEGSKQSAIRGQFKEQYINLSQWVVGNNFIVYILEFDS